jgi:hypothetical protein
MKYSVVRSPYRCLSMIISDYSPLVFRHQATRYQHQPFDYGLSLTTIVHRPSSIVHRHWYGWGELHSHAGCPAPGSQPGMSPVPPQPYGRSGAIRTPTRGDPALRSERSVSASSYHRAILVALAGLAPARACAHRFLRTACLRDSNHSAIMVPASGFAPLASRMSGGCSCC